MSETDANKSTVIRPPLAGRIGRMIATVLIAASGLFMLGSTVFIAVTGSVGVSVILLAMTGFIGVLFVYVFRDMWGKQGWRVGIGTECLILDLPGGRSLIHRLDPVHAKVRYDEIEAVETRLEAYPSFGMVIMHRAYALKLKLGDLIILGEDRALNTGLASGFLTNTIQQILQRGALEVRDLGMAKGRGGFLAVLFTSPPPWDAPSLGDEQQAVFWRKAGMTGQLAQSASSVTLFNTSR